MNQNGSATQRVNGLTFEEWLNQESSDITLPEVPKAFRVWPPAKEFWAAGYELAHAMLQYDIMETVGARRGRKEKKTEKS